MLKKTFDCVEMKHQAQEKIQAEWERRKNEFPNYGAFLEASIKESDWTRRMWQRLSRRKSTPRS
jgi:hypothetical protein